MRIPPFVMTKSSEIPVRAGVCARNPSAVATPSAARSISIFRIPRFVVFSTRARSVTSATGMCLTITFDLGPSIRMESGPSISMFSNTLPADWAIRVLIAARIAGLTPARISLATTRPFESATTDPRTPLILRRNPWSTWSSCASIPSSPIGAVSITSAWISARGIVIVLRGLDGAWTRLRAKRRVPGLPSERADGLPGSNDKVEFDDAIGDRAEEEEEGASRNSGGKGDPEEGRREGQGEDDEPRGEGAEESLDAVGHDEHPSSADILLHPREREVCQAQ